MGDCCILLPMDEVGRRDKLGLIAEWMDVHASLVRRFYFFFYPFDSSIELYDIKNNRLFLKRTRVQNLNFGDIYIGNVVTIFSRQFKFVDYANIVTKRLLEVKMMKTFALIKPDGIDKKASIFKILMSNGFRIVNLRMLKLTEEVAQKLLEPQSQSDSYLGLKGHLQSGPSIAMELVGDNAIVNLLKLAGHRDPNIARQQDPGSIIARMGSDEVHSAFYCSPSAEVAAKEISLIFENTKVLKDQNLHTAVLEDSTCCIIKPHIMKEGKFGEVVAAIEQSGYKITAMQMFYLDVSNAEEFYEIYKGVLVDFYDMVQELVSGGCVAMEIIGSQGKDTPLHFRGLVGPTDPEIARKLRPNTLRAHFGKNRVLNAVHASDLPTDGVLEVEYFFKVLV